MTHLNVFLVAKLFHPTKQYDGGPDSSVGVVTTLQVR